MVIIMQQSSKTRKRFVNLEILIDTINETYLKGRYNELERHIYNTLGIDETASLVNFLIKQYGNKNLLDNIFSTDKRDIIMERILYNLSLRYYVNVRENANGNEFYIKFFIDQYILLIFNNLLEAHKTSSKCMSSVYVNELERISKNINFKYRTDDEHRINHCLRYFMNHMDNILFKAMIEKYLNELLDRILSYLKNLSDDELEHDEIYAKAIIYQTLLRSILLIDANLERIDHYKNIYLEDNDDSIASTIIKTAFIANFNDRELIIKAKTY